MHEGVKHLPTQGHILTAFDYHLTQDRVARASYQSGMMMKYPWPEVPAGWMRVAGQQLDPTVHPNLYKVTGGILPNDPEYIIKL